MLVRTLKTKKLQNVALFQKPLQGEVSFFVFTNFVEDANIRPS